MKNEISIKNIDNPIEQLKFFLSIKDKTRLMNTNSTIILPIENYYEIGSLPVIFLGTKDGFNVKYNTDILTNYYYNEKNNIVYAESITSKKENESLGDNFFKDCDKNLSISIANYIFYNGEAVIFNRFDPKGRPHENDFSFMQEDKKSLYLNYFGNYAEAPHFHFNTRLQSTHLRNNSCANAISIRNLILYLEDLKKDDTLLVDNLGMPFLDIKKNKVSYISHFSEALDKLDISVINQFTYFHKKSNKSSGNAGLQQIIEDLNTFQLLIPKLDEYPQVIKDLGCSLSKSIATPEFEKSMKKEGKNKDGRGM